MQTGPTDRAGQLGATESGGAAPPEADFTKFTDSAEAGILLPPDAWRAPCGLSFRGDGSRSFYISYAKLDSIIAEGRYPLRLEGDARLRWVHAVQRRAVWHHDADTALPPPEHKFRAVAEAFNKLSAEVQALRGDRNSLNPASIHLSLATAAWRIEFLKAVTFGMRGRGRVPDPRAGFVTDLLVLYSIGFKRPISDAFDGPTSKFVDAVLSHAPSGSHLRRGPSRAVIRAALPSVKQVLADPAALADWCTKLGV